MKWPGFLRISRRSGLPAAAESPSKPVRRDDEHHRWLAMQSAYLAYRRATEALENADEAIEDSATNELVRLGILERQQRMAFEKYLEARIDFVEFRCDELNRGIMSRALAAGHADSTESGSWFGTCKGILQVLAFVLLCITALSLARGQNHVRDLEAARDELQAALNDTRRELQLLERRFSAGPGRQAAIQQIDQANGAPAARVRPVAPKPALPKPAKTQPTSHVPQRPPGFEGRTQKSAVPGSDRAAATIYR
jgi:hypothetical protein